MALRAIGMRAPAFWKKRSEMFKRAVTSSNNDGDDMHRATRNRMRRAYCSSFWLKRSQGEHNGLCSCLYITTRLEFRRTGSDRSDSYIRKKEKKTGPLIELALYFKKKWTGTSFFFSFFFQWLIYI
jgi:hypothetical protein